MLTSITLLCIGILILTAGGDILIRGSAALAKRANMSPMLIGLTVVSIGTSAPEFAISIYAALLNKTDIVIGNVIGSNIFNVLFALGLAAIICPLAVKIKSITLYVPAMILLSVLTYALALNHVISRIDGILLFAGFILFFIFMFKYEKKHHEQLPTPDDIKHMSLMRITLFIMLGLALLTGGSRIIIYGASSLARLLHISELIVSLTIVAAGTSLPEAVASITAARRGETDLAVGNIVGSNIMNISGVLGLSAILAPSGILISQHVLDFDLIVMLASTIACLPIFYIGHNVSRAEGIFLFMYYIIYMIYVCLAALHHTYLPFLHAALIYFCLPLTALTLCIFIIRQRSQKFI